ncbi:MAG: SUMF1/EgtB/PvdO family nonheme iron enzyme [Alphaproteobacteria bacterium]|nr:SUMF1/EgtB/PvdO family nonheme iron enzyme [Alphaproteobacteria bacterium]
MSLSLRRIMFALTLPVLLASDSGNRDFELSEQRTSSTELSSPEKLRYRILAIGIDDFGAEGVESLRFAEDDVRLFVSTLVGGSGGAISCTDPADILTCPDVTVLLGEQATRVAIMREFKRIISSAKPDEVVVLYVATHGDRPGQRGFLFAWDTELDSDLLPATSVPFSELIFAVEESDARHILIFMDACHSGQVAQESLRSPFASQKEEAGDMDGMMKQLSAAKHSVLYFSSSGPSQKSREDQRFCGGHGAFTCALSRYMGAEGDQDGDGWVTLGEAVPSVTFEVARMTSGQQHPLAYGDWDAKVALTHVAHQTLEVRPRPPDYPTVMIPLSNSDTVADGQRGQDRAALEVGAVEVSQALYREVMGENPSQVVYRNPRSAEGSEVDLLGDTLPVQGISWMDAVQFANQYSERLGYGACYEVRDGEVFWPEGPECSGFRLPTEAEWEFIVSWHGGAEPPAAQVCGLSNLGDESFGRVRPLVDLFPCDDGHPGPAPVGTFPTNDGLHDLSGNVWEWVWDWYDPRGLDSQPTGPADGTLRVVRGGGWASGTRRAEQGWRRGLEPNQTRSPEVGVRLVRSAPEGV